MKRAVQLLKFTCIILLCAVLIHACRKNPVAPADPGNSPGNPPVNPVGSVNADTISNHLQFFGATKKQGKIPKGPAASSLKISFEDTLYLMDQVRRPIKFQHLDTTKNVSGIYVQVQGAVIGGSAGTFYYDVPEVPEMADNDTVSVIMIGVDPAGLINLAGVPPAGLPSSLTCIIKIVPYGPGGQPLAEDDRPVKISKTKVDPTGTGGSCGLLTPPGEYWGWDMSYILDRNDSNKFSFYNDPDKINGAGGQNIKGCCINGNSSYDIHCSGNTAAQRSLHFATFFQNYEERFIFLADGTFSRDTKARVANPFPVESNFCGNLPGVVRISLSQVDYFGNWTIQQVTLPPDLRKYGDSLTLTLQGTSSTGGGYGNPGGVIHQLDCNTLALIQIDREGFGQHLYKFYARYRVLAPGWYPFP